MEVNIFAPHPIEKPSIFSWFGDWALYIIALLIMPFMNMQTPSSVRYCSSHTKVFEYKIERFFHDHFQLKPLSTNPDWLLVVKLLCAVAYSINCIAWLKICFDDDYYILTHTSCGSGKYNNLLFLCTLRYLTLVNHTISTRWLTTISYLLTYITLCNALTL